MPKYKNTTKAEIAQLLRAHIDSIFYAPVHHEDNYEEFINNFAEEFHTCLNCSDPSTLPTGPKQYNAVYETLHSTQLPVTNMELKDLIQLVYHFVYLNEGGGKIQSTLALARLPAKLDQYHNEFIDKIKSTPATYDDVTENMKKLSVETQINKYNNLTALAPIQFLTLPIKEQRLYHFRTTEILLSDEDKRKAYFAKAAESRDCARTELIMEFIKTSQPEFDFDIWLEELKMNINLLQQKNSTNEMPILNLNHCICPITNNVIVNLVKINGFDNYYFEADALINWVLAKKSNPITRDTVLLTDIVPVKNTEIIELLTKASNEIPLNPNHASKSKFII